MTNEVYDAKLNYQSYMVSQLEFAHIDPTRQTTERKDAAYVTIHG